MLYSNVVLRIDSNIKIIKNTKSTRTVYHVPIMSQAPAKALGIYTENSFF